MSLFGFGKKENKPPYKPPRELISLRNRIDSEMRENFPNLGRYQQIVSEADAICRELNANIVQKDYAEEATRLRDDLKARLAQLAAKIDRNRKDAAKDGKDDYIDRNIDYLKRKSFRNTAKSLFTEFLDQVQLFKKCCIGERIEHGRTLDSVVADMARTLTALNTGFFKEHGNDKEIDGLKREVLGVVGDLNDFLIQNKATISQNGLESRTNLIMTHIMTAVKDIQPATH